MFGWTERKADKAKSGILRLATAMEAPMDQLTFRRAKPHDAGHVSMISERAYVPAYRSVIGEVPKPAREDCASRIEDGSVWLAECSGNAVGVLVLERSPDYLMIYSIAVHPRYQGRGIGAALLRFAEKRASEHSLPEVRLYTNSRMEKNLALYRKAGFRAVGERPHPSRPGEFLVDMSKQVAPDDGS